MRSEQIDLAAEVGVAHEVFVDGAGALAAFADGVDDQRLAAAVEVSMGFCSL